MCFLGASLNAQKVGHVNTVQLIDSLAEARQASGQLKQYEATLSKTGEEMVTKFQDKLKKYKVDVKSGNLTPTQQKQMESDLEVEQEAIGNYRESAKKSLEKRRLELVQPILDKINKAIHEIGKEENYTFIFDNSAGILFFRDSEDVSQKVYKKLGY
jgi:outer membrane protein